MKKSLFSLLILSTLSLSTQAIAQQVKIGATQNIDISGRVLQEALTCNLEPVAAIALDDAYVNSIANTPKKDFSIDFSGCTNQASNRDVKVVIVRKGQKYLMNATQSNDDTNARLALLDSNGAEVVLDSPEDVARTFTSDVVGQNGKIKFSLKYMPPVQGDVTAGAFSSSLSFDAYVADDIN
ncbi:fimbrial protein [Proteus mirabilis]|uniref:fimbrial protein n=1 Tax=Proteus mirabilis TaxID=584 RepID=UPI003FD78279